jgi:hypothetical protein
LPVFRLPKTVRMEVVQKALAERRSFDEFVALAFGPEAMGPKPITVSSDQLSFAREIFFPQPAQGEEGTEPEATTPSMSRRYRNLVPVLMMWFREFPRTERNFQVFLDLKLAGMNGSVSAANESPRRTSNAASAMRERGRQTLIAIIAAGQKKCSKCGKTKALDKFSRERNPYYPEVGDEWKAGSWCRDCSTRAASGGTTRPYKKRASRVEVTV